MYFFCLGVVSKVKMFFYLILKKIYSSNLSSVISQSYRVT